MADKPTQVDFTPDGDRDLHAVVEHMRRNREANDGYICEAARMRWVAYTELLRQGFTTDQALALCVTITPVD